MSSSVTFWEHRVLGRIITVIHTHKFKYQTKAFVFKRTVYRFPLYLWQRMWYINRNCFILTFRNFLNLLIFYSTLPINPSIGCYNSQKVSSIIKVLLSLVLHQSNTEIKLLTNNKKMFYVMIIVYKLHIKYLLFMIKIL